MDPTWQEMLSEGSVWPLPHLDPTSAKAARQATYYAFPPNARNNAFAIMSKTSRHSEPIQSQS